MMYPENCENICTCGFMVHFIGMYIYIIHMLDSFMFEMACFWDDFVSILFSAMSYLFESSWCSVHVQWDGHQMWTAVSQVCNTCMFFLNIFFFFFSESSMKCNQMSKNLVALILLSGITVSQSRHSFKLHSVKWQQSWPLLCRS